MRAAGCAALCAVALEGALLAWGPARIAATLAYTDVLYIALLVLACAVGLVWAARGRRGRPGAARSLSEALLFAALVLYLFGYIYAANANMDYVQRFAASGGNVRLAPDTRTERLAATIRYVPLIAVGVLGWLASDARARQLSAGADASTEGTRLPARFAFPLSLLSSLLMALSFPSFLSAGGMGWLAFISYVPLYVVLSAVSSGRAVFYGAASWTVQVMLTNYWLGTYSLISLQAVTVLLSLEGTAFFSVAVLIHRFLRRRLPSAAWLVLPAAGTVFDWLRTAGFAGYPWGLAGTTQYAFPPVLQIASFTGVWGVGFLVLVSNAAVAWALTAPEGERRRSLVALGAAMALLGGTVAAGALWLRRPGTTPVETVRLALIQQNADPRKNDYDATFETLRRLTDATLPSRPDLVVWSETAFVPNIRRWSAVDPAEQHLADLVHRFLDYQKGTGCWLLTGNDDYDLVGQGENEERLDFNATILFAPTGERVRTYHKMRLVPITESFPWKKALPGLHKLLLSFDVYLWEPGEERVIFEHPRFRFCTPICFEDAFPDHVRRFVLRGLDVILNVSNDYWSLTEVEARQHAANAVFRAVENRKPVVRATASGLTVFIDSRGRQVRSLPCYVEGALVVDVPLERGPATPYQRWGDWFPVSCALLLGLLIALAFRARPSPA